MISIKNKIRLITGLIFTSVSANAGVKVNVNSQSLETKYFQSCDRLMELESRSSLSEVEFSEGEVLHDLISQVSDEPLSYCDHVQMAGALEDLGGDNFL